MRIKSRKLSKIMWTSSGWVSFAWSSVASFQGGCFLTIFCLSVILAYRAYKRSQSNELPARDISKGHPWCPIDAFSSTAYCSVCETLIIDGFYCDSCGVCADRSCVKKADKNLNCKALSIPENTLPHHWVKGNLPCISPCDVCQVDCGTEGALVDFRCCWCQRIVHPNCLNKTTENCDFGFYRSFVIPPYCITLKKVGIKGNRHLVVDEVKSPTDRSWSPLIVIGNRKSGNNEGASVLRSFRGYLNPLQVIDLHDIKPEKGLLWCKLITDHVCRILVAGGDGTVGWVLNAIDKLNIEPPPQVCILPLGTGNDLSRVLDWGYCYSGEVDVKRLLDRISSADMMQLDRWKIKITPTRHLPLPHPSKIIAFNIMVFEEYFMNNYASVGVDALVTLNFHRTRNSKFYLFGSRLINRLVYIIYGVKDVFDRGCENLHKKIEVYLDGERLDLPHLEALVILNIPCWGGGVKPWELGPPEDKYQPQRFDDGMLEVFGIYSSFHIAQMQVSLSEPMRLGQARNVMIRLLERLPIQIDGEPWEQQPSEINIVYHKQATVLKNVQ